MLPVYFPFTSIDERLMRALGRIFSKVVVYQMMEPGIPERMKRWREEGRLDIRLPMQHLEKKLTAVLRDFRTWAGDHLGGDLTFFKAQGGGVPFYSGTSVAQIRKDIRVKSEGGTAGEGDDAGELYPALFLQMAQELDEKNREIVGDLESQAQNEHALMHALKGYEGAETLYGPGTVVAPEDSSVYMLPQRLAAWTRLVSADGLWSPLLITSQSGVLEELAERASVVNKEMSFLQTVTAPSDEGGSSASFQNDLMEYLEALSTHPWNAENKPPPFACGAEPAAGAVGLSLYIFPGVNPYELLGGFYNGGVIDAPGGQPSPAVFGNTLVGVAGH